MVRCRLNSVDGIRQDVAVKLLKPSLFGSQARSASVTVLDAIDLLTEASFDGNTSSGATRADCFIVLQLQQSGLQKLVMCHSRICCAASKVG